VVQISKFLNPLRYSAVIIIILFLTAEPTAELNSISCMYCSSKTSTYDRLWECVWGRQV